MALPLVSKLVIAAVVVGSGAYLVLSDSGEGVLEYVYVHQVTENPARFAGRTFKVHGTVVEGTVKQKVGAAGDYTFEIHHEGQKLPIHFTNMLVDTFAEGGEVILTGHLREDGVFESEEMSAKCPSKYEEQAEASRELPGAGG
ncbi:MAG: cytochrome c maturation protein CcmE [Nannocystaceae bacterium]